MSCSRSPSGKARATAVSARGLFEREKSVQHDLLAVEIDSVRLGEEFGDLFPYLHPAIKAAAPQQLGEWTALAGFGGLGDGARERRRHQLRQHAERVLAAPARDPVGEGVERAAVELREPPQELKQAAMEGETALLRQLDRMADAALGELDERAAVGWREVRAIAAQQLRHDRVGERPEREPAAARADGRQEAAGIVADEDQDRARRRLLQDLQDRVRGVAVHLVGGV